MGKDKLFLWVPLLSGILPGSAADSRGVSPHISQGNCRSSSRVASDSGDSNLWQVDIKTNHARMFWVKETLLSGPLLMGSKTW